MKLYSWVKNDRLTIRRKEVKNKMGWQKDLKDTFAELKDLYATIEEEIAEAEDKAYGRGYEQGIADERARKEEDKSNEN